MISIRRFWWLLQAEFRLTRGLLIFHFIGIVLPLVDFFLLLQVGPTVAFPMYIAPDGSPQAQRLTAAMASLRADGVADGPFYVDVQPFPAGAQLGGTVQDRVEMQAQDDHLLVTHYYASIDSNLVKNYRNRLTGAALDVWEEDLGGRAVTLDLEPRYAVEPGYARYLGMGLLVLAIWASAMFIGAPLAAKDFEDGTILEAQLSPVSPALILAARLVRLVFTSLLAVGLAAGLAGLQLGIWPGDVGRFAGLMVLYAVVAACFGLVVGLLVRKILPAALMGLVATIVLWILGGGFARPMILGPALQVLSRFAPTTYMIQLLFPLYYPDAVTSPMDLAIVGGYAVGFFVLLVAVYRGVVLRRQ